MDVMSMAEVHPFPVKLKGHDKIVTEDRHFGGCQHKRAIVDPKLALLTCADCAAALNPIEFLIGLAHQESLFKHQLDSIAKARQEMDERKRCRCTKCGEWTEIRRVHNREVARIKDGG
jgi:hypothetical protein